MACCETMVILDDLSDAGSSGLNGKGDDGGGSSSDGRPRPARPVVGGSSSRRRLADVDVGIDSSRDDVASLGVDYLAATCRFGEVLCEGGDNTVWQAKAKPTVSP